MSNAISGLGSKLVSAVNDVQTSIVSTQGELASGNRTLNQNESGVVSRLSAQSTSYGSIVKNITFAQNVVSVAQTSLGSISSIISQLKDLALQSSSVGVNDADRISLQKTFAALANQITSLGLSANVNGSNLLNPETTPSLVVVTDIPSFDKPATAIASVDIPTLATAIGATPNGGSPALDISSVAGATAALDTLNIQLDTVATAQASLAAASTGLNAVQSNAQSLSSGLTAVAATIQKIDSTRLQLQLQALNTQQTVDYYLVTQLNTSASAILNLFR